MTPHFLIAVSEPFYAKHRDTGRTFPSITLLFVLYFWRIDHSDPQLYSSLTFTAQISLRGGLQRALERVF